VCSASDNGHHSIITNMAVVRNFEVMSNEFNIDKICILSSFHNRYIK
jgi:hypothetical protein